MANKCLKTQLKANVNNENLPIIDSLSFPISGITNQSVALLAPRVTYISGHINTQYSSGGNEQTCGFTSDKNSLIVLNRSKRVSDNAIWIAAPLDCKFVVSGKEYVKELRRENEDLKRNGAASASATAVALLRTTLAIYGAGLEKEVTHYEKCLTNLRNLKEQR